MKKYLNAVFAITKFILTTVTILISGFLVWWLVLIPIANNVILNGYVKELKQYDVGAEFEIVEQASACGKLYGNGNGMEYMAVLLIKCEKELEETSMDGSWEGIWVIHADNDKRLEGLLNIHSINRTQNIRTAWKELESMDGYYMLYSSHYADGESVLNWDLRAH